MTENRRTIFAERHGGPNADSGGRGSRRHGLGLATALARFGLDGTLLANLGRGAGGALLFGLPVMLTSEVWHLGFSMEPYRLTLLVCVNLPLLVFLSRYAGFEQTTGIADDLRDAAIALGLGILASSGILWLFGVIDLTMPLREVVGKVALQAVPASIGALLGRSQLGGEHAAERDRRQNRDTYFSEVFLMGIGALFLSFNIAPTQEVAEVAIRISPAHAIGLVALSLAVMHGFVFALSFHGGTELDPDRKPGSAFFPYTMVGYVVALSISLYALWTFGRLDGASPAHAVSMVVVLGFPAAVGAAAARLIL